MRNRRERGINVEFIVSRLRNEHERLDAEVAELDHRLHLTPAEEMRLLTLKKAKLRAKDRLRALVG